MLLTLSLPEYMMASGKVALTFESVEWCNHSNETSLAVLSPGVICCSAFYKNKIWKFFQLLTFGSERVNSCDRHA